MFRRFFSVLLGLLALTAAAAALAESFYLPGTYTATAQGCGGGVTVEVIFDETQIASVTVVEHSETAGICEPAIESIPELIVEGQTLTALIARKDALSLKIRLYKEIASTASQTTYRARNTEIKIKSTISVADWQAEIDQMSKELRLLDNQLQQSNWNTDLIE